MSSNSSSIVISFSIAILLLLTLLLLISYNSKCKMDNVERFENDNMYPNITSTLPNMLNTFAKKIIPNRDNVNHFENKYEIPNVNAASNPVQGAIAPNDISTQYTSPSGTIINNESESFINYSEIDKSQDKEIDNSCFVRDRLTSKDLLPNSADNSKWALINPSGSGLLEDQNFLTAGYHSGIDTVGQSLRNANLQLRSEPPNPQIAVSPWGNSTIEPDIRVVSFEIGSAPSY